MQSTVFYAVILNMIIVCMPDWGRVGGKESRSWPRSYMTHSTYSGIYGSTCPGPAPMWFLMALSQEQLRYHFSTTVREDGNSTGDGGQSDMKARKPSGE